MNEKAIYGKVNVQQHVMEKTNVIASELWPTLSLISFCLFLAAGDNLIELSLRSWFVGRVGGILHETDFLSRLEFLQIPIQWTEIFHFNEPRSLILLQKNVTRESFLKFDVRKRRIPR